MSKIITVFGATGNQGGSVITEILRDPELSKVYKIRAVTRDPSKPAGKALEEKGCEVVAANLNDTKSITAAIDGASVVFGVTNCKCIRQRVLTIDWESMDANVELSQGKAIVDAAVHANAEYIIWSSLPPVKKLTNGKLQEVEHFDSKAAVEAYIREKEIPAAFYMPAMFFSNWKSMIRKTEDGNFAVSGILKPDMKVPFIDIAKDSGRFVGAVLKNPVAFNGQWVIGATGFYTMNEMSETIAKKTGKDVRYTQIPDEVLLSIMEKTGNPKAGELVQNLQWVRDYGYYGADSEKKYEETIKLVPAKLSSWQEYVDENWPFIE